tara:strand:- start:3177 stop:3629 length:453 start_codon:yes stop_codon:yes gene_type:complete
VAASLHEDMPWMGRATEYVWHALRRSAQRGEPITLRPVILNGPPGIGKSIWARSLAAALSLPYGNVDASKGGAGMALVGVERGWGSAQAGRPIDLMLAKRIANPLIVVYQTLQRSRFYLDAAQARNWLMRLSMIWRDWSGYQSPVLRQEF